MNADEQEKVDCVGHMMFSLMFILCVFCTALGHESIHFPHFLAY